jgi:hypothetical protein
MSERRRLLMAQQETNWEKLDYLTIIPNESLVINIKPAYCASEGAYIPLEYRIRSNSESWTAINGDVSIPLNSGEKLQIRGDSEAYINYWNLKGVSYTWTHINSEEGGIYDVAGTPLSLYKYNIDDAVEYYQGGQTFFLCNELFRNSIGLREIKNPKTFLPYVRIGQYRYMFAGCKSLINAPDIQGVNVGRTYAFERMFDSCENLITGPTEMPESIYTRDCNFMFNKCYSLKNPPKLPATTLNQYCYYRMFANCTSLEKSPDLPAITLVEGCYQYMFNGCSVLSRVKAMFKTTPNSSFTYAWLSGVSSTGTFIKNKDATWNVTGTSGIPSGWTVIKE